MASFIQINCLPPSPRSFLFFEPHNSSLLTFRKRSKRIWMEIFWKAWTLSILKIDIVYDLYGGRNRIHHLDPNYFGLGG